ncbi:hypothetical protein DFH29DRAFT_919637 [Suillus ampliporus]|nr:hypothetical protein DFH29DRAFT_919637 [Suillus ampliporus]
MQSPYNHVDQPPIRQSEVQQFTHMIRDATPTNTTMHMAQPAKPTGACARCKSLKVRCEFSKHGNNTCKRCTGAGQQCVIPERKPRRTPSSIRSGNAEHELA